MKNENAHFHFNVYRIFWGVILCWIVIAGVIGLKTPRNTPKAYESNAYSGSDGLLSQLLATHDGSQKILDALAATDRRGKIAVFWPGMNSDAILSSYMISYLAWPQQVWSVPMDDKRIAKAVEDFKNASFKTAVFYALKPPVLLPGGKRIGPMFIEPLTSPLPK